MSPNTIVDLFPTTHIVLLLGDLLYVLALISSTVELCASNTAAKLENILCFKTCVGGKGRVGKNNQPPKQKPQISSLETWSHQEFLFVLGK